MKGTLIGFPQRVAYPYMTGYDLWKTTRHHDCDEDGHVWKLLGRDSEGYPYFKCSVCGFEDNS